MKGEVELHVVLGAGPLGMAVVRELLARGKRTRVICRSGVAYVPTRVLVLRADAADPVAMRAACEEATVVYHCAQPPYTQWSKRAPAMMQGAIEGAAAAGARLVYGDNLYMYGPVSGALTEDLPYRARGVNGRTRARLADMVMAAHERGRLQAAIGRASDFYGPQVRSAALGERVFAAALKGEPARVLGDPDAPHTYTYIDDFARGLVTLGERDEAPGQVWHVPSAETLTTRRFVEMVYEELDRPVQMRAAGRLAVSALALVSPAMRRRREVLYQFERAFVVDHGKYRQAFGAQTTPHREAIHRTLDWYRDNPE